MPIFSGLVAKKQNKNMKCGTYHISHAESSDT